MGLESIKLRIYWLSNGVNRTTVSVQFHVGLIQLFYEARPIDG